jgi:hypothetical protein
MIFVAVKMSWTCAADFTFLQLIYVRMAEIHKLQIFDTGLTQFMIDCCMMSSKAIFHL